MNNVRYIQKMESYTMLKLNELSRHKKIWSNLKCILLGGRSQSENATYCFIPTIQHSGKSKTVEIIKVQWCGCQGEGDE